jgi:hypothetical protein
MTAEEDIETRAKGPASTTRQDPRVRSWTLLLLDATSRNGLTPISKLRFHRLAYLANTLSRVYGLAAADERVVKHRRGPFYPDLQWHLDRLVGQRLARVQDVRHFTDDDGAWMDASYALAPRAASVLEALYRVETMAALASFRLEVVRAFAAQEDEALDELPLEDVTYDDLRRSEGAVIDFSKFHDNLSAQAAEAFAKFAPDPRAVTVEDRIHLYVEYMDRKRAKRAAE